MSDVRESIDTNYPAMRIIEKFITNFMEVCSGNLKPQGVASHMVP